MGEAARTDTGKSRPKGIRVTAGVRKGTGEPRGGAVNLAWGVIERFLKEVVFKPGPRR